MLDRMPCSVLVCTRQGTVTYANPAVGQLLGLPVDRLEGRAFWEVFGTPEIECAARHYFEMVLATHVEALGCSGLLRRQRDDRLRGTLTPVVLRDGKGEPETVLCVLHAGVPSEPTVNLEADFLIGFSREGQLFVIRGEEREPSSESGGGNDIDAWFQRVLGADDRRELQKHVDAVLCDDSTAAGSVVRTSMWVQGTLRPVWWRALPLRRHGKSVAVVMVGHFQPTTAPEEEIALPLDNLDVPAKILEAEGELRQYLRVLETVFHTIPDAAWLKDCHGRFVLVNRAYAALYGLTPRDIIGKTCHDFLREEAAREIDESDQNVIYTRSTLKVHQRRRAPNGTDLEFETAKVPVLNEAGEVIGIVGLSREVTECRQHTRELEEYRDELQRQVEEYREELARETARLEALCDAIPDLVIVMNAEGLIVRVHEGMESREWLVSRREEGKCLCDVLPQRVAAVFQDGISEARRTSQVVTKTWSFRRGEEAEFFRTRFRRYVDDQVIAVVEDVSESVARQEAIRQEAERLARVQRISLAGGLAAGIAHELNQPLASLALYASTGKEAVTGQKAPNRELLIDLFEKIDLLATRCGEITRNLRRFIRQRSLDAVSVSTSTLFHNALLLAESSILHSGVDVELSVPDHLRVVVDDVQIQQVLLNLISNALDAFEECPPEQRVLCLGAERRGRYVEFFVRDSGCGMSPSDVEHIFDPFFTTKPQGIGMGLAICRSIIESHGGQIWVESQLGSGTTVRFSIPAETANASPSAQTEENTPNG